MAFRDLREFIEVLGKTGDLIRITEEVDWNLEAGAITRRSNEKQGPAILFERIKGYPPGFRLMGGTIATYRRLAIAMGLNPEASYSEILDAFIERIKNPIKPIILSTGPCKENILVDDQVDIFILPAPMVHDKDGGRFIGTLNQGVCKDPNSDWVNWGIYRLMVHDKKSTGAFISSVQHVGVIYGKYEERGQAMPYAAFIGCEPITSFIAATAIPYGVSEVDVIGGLRGEPVELVKCETIDLYVPATAEIVLEGEVPPYERKEEGPFGEYAGYQISGKYPRPVFKVKAITYRRDPILPMACIGVPTDDGHIIWTLGMAANFKNMLLQEGYPITEVYLPPQGAGHLCVVGTKTPYPHIAQRIANLIWSSKAGWAVPRVMVVNNDIDPSNMDEVLHAFATKCHPARGTFVQEKFTSSPITGFLWPEERNIYSGSAVVYDCTWPAEWPPEAVPLRSSFKTIYPEEVQKIALEKLGKYGFKG